MAHPPRALLLRIARLLEPPIFEDLLNTLLSAAMVPGARQLAPLVLLVERDVADQFAATFARGSALDDRYQVTAVLRELACHYDSPAEPAECAAHARSIAPVASALTGVDDPFYRRVGEILLEDVILVLDPAADPRDADVTGPGWDLGGGVSTSF